MAQKRQRSPNNTPSTDRPPGDSQSKTDLEEPQIFQSSTIHDRSSTFIGIFSPSQQYLARPKNLRLYEAFSNADNRMLAYRKKSNQKALSFTAVSASASASASAAAEKSTYTTWSDDDDEKYAGKKLEKVLIDLDVEGVVVVARWWGGILLGPVRFEHILNVAREAIGKWKGNNNDESHEDGRGGKRLKSDGNLLSVANIVDEAQEKKRLVKILEARDTSVDVLRGLLNEKSGELEKLVDAAAEKISRDKEDLREEQGGISINEGVAGSSVMEHGDTKRNVKDGVQATSHPQPTPNNLPMTPPMPSSRPDYASMPLQRLKQLEKARDASIGWILKQIDGVEIKTKEAERKIERHKSSSVETLYYQDNQT